ncbi:MAG: hypothetical protein OEY38_07650 [Gammaproteobacteria bacterium]|nr:hypothetical protein [Gammaproteobacteria bacterium]
MRLTLRNKIFLLMLSLQVFCTGFSTPYAQTQNQSYLTQSLQSISLTQAIVSHKITHYADKLDTFFGGQRSWDKINGSQIQLSSVNRSDATKKINHQFDTRIKLDLPKTNRRFSFVFETSQTDNTLAETQEPSDEGTNETEQQQAQSTIMQSMLRWAFHKGKKWQYRADGGFEFHPKPIPKTQLAAIQEIDKHQWLFRISEKIEWNLKNKFQQQNRLDMERQLKGWHFKSSSLLQWQQSSPGILGRQQFFLYHQLTGRYGLYYLFEANTVNQPKPSVRDTSISVHFRQRLAARWLFLDAVPKLEFSHSNRFRPYASFTLTLQLILGHS